MTYTLPAWSNNPSTATPLDAANLLELNDAITDLDSRTTVVETEAFDTAVAVDAKVDLSLATAVGDIAVASEANVFGTLNVGTDGQVLVADSSQILGTKWDDAPASGVVTVTAGDSSVDVDSTDPANPTVAVIQANLTVAESQVTGLTSDLGTLTTAVSGKANTTHTHAESDVTSLVSDLGNKATDSAVVHNTGAETVAGVKTFSSAPVVPTPGASGNPVRNDDSRLSNSRAPSGTAGGSLAGSYPNPTFAAGSVGGTEVASAIKDPIAATAGLRTLGTGSAQACAGNDSRLSDARTPTAHASSHASGGTDPLDASDIGAVSDDLITAIGDLLVGASAGVPGTLNVGSDGQILTANSGATLGAAWAAPVSPAWSTFVETLADGSTLSPNCNSGATRVGSCTSLSQSTTLNAPSNGAVGATYRAQLTASGGPWTITLSGWVGTTDNATSAISLPSGKTISILGEYCGAGWLYGGYTLQS